jgi:ribonuclease J
MEKKGFCMLIRNGKWFRKNLEKYFSASYRRKSLLIYSMWPGYLDGLAKNQSLCDFLGQYPSFETLHTGGHASPNSIAQLYDTVKPKHGLIPIHSDTPEAFQTLIPNGNIIMLNDGEKFEL